MSSDITIWGNSATITVPVRAMPAIFDATDAGRPTHTTLTITVSELRALAGVTAAAVERIDAALATTAGQLTGGLR